MKPINALLINKKIIRHIIAVRPIMTKISFLYRYQDKNTPRQVLLKGLYLSQKQIMMQMWQNGETIHPKRIVEDYIQVILWLLL